MDMITDYSQVCIQLGFVTLFVVANPIIPLIGLVRSLHHEPLNYPLCVFFMWICLTGWWFVRLVFSDANSRGGCVSGGHICGGTHGRLLDAGLPPSCHAYGRRRHWQLAEGKLLRDLMGVVFMLTLSKKLMLYLAWAS
jgi:hypothetical protein